MTHLCRPEQNSELCHCKPACTSCSRPEHPCNIGAILQVVMSKQAVNVCAGQAEVSKTRPKAVPFGSVSDGASLIPLRLCLSAPTLAPSQPLPLAVQLCMYCARLHVIDCMPRKILRTPHHCPYTAVNLIRSQDSSQIPQGALVGNPCYIFSRFAVAIGCSSTAPQGLCEEKCTNQVVNCPRVWVDTSFGAYRLDPELAMTIMFNIVQLAVECSSGFRESVSRCAS